jgi:Dyp-type peroxidase family
MATDHRKRLLGDTAEADPEHWKWGGPKNPTLHAMLFIFTIDQDRLEDILDVERGRALKHRVTLGAPLDTNWMGDKEHFGFNDGIAQPLIAGFGDGQVGTNGRGLEIPAGEVLLGFANAYDRVPLSPTVPDNDVSARFLECIKGPDKAVRRDFGRNGSYIVFRQLKQNVKAFWEDVDRRAQSDPTHRKLLAAKMVGRWPNGAPLVRHPCCEPAQQPEKTELNNFWYRDDLDGDRCPVGAHIRRTNPRDGLRPDTEESLKVANRHRLLRRGRAYGQPIAQSFDPDDILKAPAEHDPHRGLHFICFNTDIARQFEFVQSTWANSTKFDGLYRDPDPLIAPNGAKRAEDKGIFTIQHSPVRQRHHELKRFVTPVGGAYLFMPGINALRYLTVAPSAAINEPTGTRPGRD